MLLLFLSYFSCVRLCGPQRWQPTSLPLPWVSPGKNIGVCCHFLLQCMKVKTERDVAQSCPTLSDPMDWTLPGSSVHGVFHARVLEWGAIYYKLVKLSWKTIWLYLMFEQIHFQWPNKCKGINLTEIKAGVSLGVQWLRICLITQGTRGRSLAGETESHMSLGN